MAGARGPALRKLRRGRRARRRDGLRDRPSARAAVRRSATTRATSRRSSAPGNRLREARRWRAPTAIPEWQYATTCAASGRPTMLRTSSGGRGMPGPANNVETSTGSARRGYGPVRGSHGAPFRPPYSPGPPDIDDRGGSGVRSRASISTRVGTGFETGLELDARLLGARRSPVSSSARPSRRSRRLAPRRADGRRARSPAPPSAADTQRPSSSTTSRSSPVIPWRRRRRPASRRERPDNLFVRELPRARRRRAGSLPGRRRARARSARGRPRGTRSSSPEVLRKPAPVDDGRQLAPARHATIAETISSSAAIPGRSASRSSQSATAGYQPRSRSRYACARGGRGTRRCRRSRTRSR